MDKFYEILQPIISKKCKEENWEELELTEDKYNLDCEENYILIRWEEEIYQCGCCKPEIEERHLHINEEEIEEILSKLPEEECEKDKRIRELEQRLAQETYRRRELERSRPYC